MSASISLILAQDVPVEVKEGLELRFGASTRSYLVHQPQLSGAQSGTRKRGVQWPDADGGGVQEWDLPLNLLPNMGSL